MRPLVDLARREVLALIELVHQAVDFLNLGVVGGLRQRCLRPSLALVPLGTQKVNLFDLRLGGLTFRVFFSNRELWEIHAGGHFYRAWKKKGLRLLRRF